jgi:hypothetical protein
MTETEKRKPSEAEQLLIYRHLHKENPDSEIFQLSDTCMWCRKRLRDELSRWRGVCRPCHEEGTRCIDEMERKRGLANECCSCGKQLDSDNKDFCRQCYEEIAAANPLP